MNELSSCFNIFDDQDILEFIAMKGKCSFLDSHLKFFFLLKEIH